LAVSRRERDYAQEALRLSDLLVDLAFSSALRNAEDFPTTVTPETRALAAKVKEAEGRVSVDEERVDELKDRVGRAKTSTKDGILQEFELAQQQLSLDQEELEDAHQCSRSKDSECLSQSPGSN